MIIKLSDLKLGQSAKIIGFEAMGAACRQKMFAYGLLPGSEITLVRLAPLGDPMQLSLAGDIMLSIRKSEGHNVTVELA